VNQGAGRDHFGIQKRMLRNQPMKITAVSIGPIQHRGNAEFSAGLRVFILCAYQFLMGGNGLGYGLAAGTWALCGSSAGTL